MIVLKANQDQVLVALQAVAGIVERRHALPILENVLMRSRGATSIYQQYARWFARLRRGGVVLPRLQPLLASPAVEMVRPTIKLALGRVRQLRGFFGATKVNARNAP